MSIFNGGRRAGYRSRRNTMGWFFDVIFPKLFLFMVVAMIAWFGFVGYMAYTIGTAVLDDPAVIGRTLGTVVQGFQETQTK